MHGPESHPPGHQHAGTRELLEIFLALVSDRVALIQADDMRREPPKILHSGVIRPDVIPALVGRPTERQEVGPDQNPVILPERGVPLVLFGLEGTGEDVPARK